MSTRYRSGGVTVTVDDGLERWMRGLMDAAEAETIALLEAEAREVMEFARGRWYQEVERETGKSGDLEVVTTFTDTGDVIVGVRSKDTRVRGGKPVAAMVHRPGPLSRSTVEVTRAEYGRIKKGPKPREAWKSRRTGKHYALVHNKGSSDGQVLFIELVRKPLFKRVPSIAAKLGEQIVLRQQGGG